MIPRVTLLDVLGIEVPVVQAPMAGSSGSALAVAVSEAGGLGSLPTAMLTADQVRTEVGAIRAGHAPFDDELCALVEELRPPVASFHFGLPDSSLVERVRATGARVLSSATTVAEARWSRQLRCWSSPVAGSAASPATSSALAWSSPSPATWSARSW